MKAIITSDVHVHKYKRFNQDNRRLNNCIQLLEELWDKAGTQDSMLWIAGDIFNNMQLIQTEVIVAVTALFKRKSIEHPNVVVLIISGNHDYATKNLFENPAVSAVEALGRVSDNVFIIDNRSYNWGGGNVYGLPYYEDKVDLRKALERLSKEAEIAEGKHFLLMHQVVGIDIDLVQDDIDPLDPLFNPFEVVFNGHIHQYKEVTHGWYNIGSPMHRDASDIGQTKGYLEIEVQEPGIDFRFIPTKGYPEFRRLQEGLDVPEEWKDDYILRTPAKIAITPEEEEIQENFNHSTNSRETLLDNFTAIKLADADAKFKKEVNSYGKSLVRYAS